MARLVSACALLILAGSAAHAEDGPRFLNRTGQTIVRMYLAAAGTKTWGVDQCKNDDEGMVDHNERMTLVGVKSGRYDIKLSEQGGRTCIVKNIELKEGAQFVVRDTDLTECSK